MKKIAFVLALLMLVLPITANAATARSIEITPGIQFNGNTANCTVSVAGNATRDEIDVVVKLWQGSTCIVTWTTSGNGYVYFSKNRTVRSGVEYTLTADVTINGITQPTVSISGRST